MAPSLEHYDDITTGLPIKALATKQHGITGISAFELEDADKHDVVLRYFRVFIADLCEQFKGGHPGSAMGMAAIGVALYKYVMRFSPKNGNYFNRDRFVLSNGRAAFLSILLLQHAYFVKATHVSGNTFSCISWV
jgi:dihydroxyacetone synthase